MEISLAAESLFKLGPVEVTNSLLSAFVIVIFLSLLSILISTRLKQDKPGKFQLLVEMLVGGFRGMTKDIVDKSYSDKLFGFLFTFFLFILISNWFGLLPFVGPIVVEHHAEEVTHVEDSEAQATVKTEEVEVRELDEEPEHEEVTVGGCIKDRDCVLLKDGVKKTEAFPLFRAPTSDVSATLALALISVLSINILGVKSLGLGYFKKFFNFKDPMSAFVGILETISEFSKIVSFAFRLFGNVFAGEVLLLVITSITFGLATLPFLLLEVFVGFIQALVFFMLTTVFISIAVTGHEEH